MAKRKHSGVTLIKPEPARERVDSKTGKLKRSGAMGWRVRFTDPDSGKTVKRALDRSLRTKADREDYACRLSDQLARRRLDLESGASKATGTPIADAIQRFFAAHPSLRPKTVTTYEAGTDKLVRFAQKHRIRTVDDLDRRKLMVFREQLIKQPKRQNAAKGRRGQKIEGAERRSNESINRELRAVKTCLLYLIDADLFTKLSPDDVRRCCKPLKTSTDRKDFMRPAAMQKLLAAARRHDSDTFRATRAEHGGEARQGMTPKYPPIAPIVLFVGLSGCRFGEAIDLTWDRVDLDALDASGKAVGEIYIDSSSKTAKARTIGLEVSGVLRTLLAAQRLKTGGKGSVFGLTPGEARAGMKRLKAQYGAPEAAGWQILRVTVATYLCNAPGIYGAASAFMESRQLGHSILVAEQHYVGLIRGIPIEARTLEAAMQIEAEAAKIVKTIGHVPKKRAAAAR
jgi:integrase